MKIGIVIPLKAKKISNDWGQVQRSLERTLNSVISQSSDSYEVCVVGHDKPDCLAQPSKFSNKVRFYSFDLFSPPTIVKNATDENRLKFERDRCYKILTGVVRLNAEIKEIDYWFPLDADDLIHRDFVSTLSNLPKADAYLIEKGYVYYEAMRVLNRINNFSNFCGSSSVLSNALVNTNIEINEEGYSDFIFARVGHTDMANYLKTNHINFVIPQKRLAVYMRDNGENISRTSKPNLFYDLKRNLKALVRYQYFSSRIRKSFSFPT